MADKHAIIGFGISGMLVYLQLIKKGIEPSNIFIFDPDFLGGDLARYYSSVNSNTTWSKILEIFPEAMNIFPEFESDKITNLIYLPKVLEKLCQKNISNSELYLANVLKLCYKDSKWNIISSSDSYFADIVYLCQGGKPKTQNIPGKCIPLHIALDKDILKRHIEKGSTYTIFGLSHSGTLALKNLVDLGAHVNAIYKTPMAFQYARDGFYSGIKQESEQIADNIENMANVKLISASDITSVTRALLKTTAFINAIGFEPRQIEIYVDDSLKSSLKYSPETGLLEDCPNCYGFGFSYPSVTVINNKKYQDISLSAFYQQISRIL